ncbi:MAG: diacylglycerol kinase family lipid kinase [Verrucomicrobia bacterium]|nr:diacylglycerol kinase family lipid kinase [Verrucomicrobiota bacterium]
MPPTVVILNPAARSQRAAGVCRTIEALVGNEATLHRTSKPGEARSLARQAVAKGFEQIVVAGGDGTVNEVVNGIAGSTATLGILPVGTMNVFAAELGLPKGIKECWGIIQAGVSRVIDLPMAAEHAFVQVAGVGFDAQTLKETSWDAKRNLGPLSYVISAAQVAARKPPRLVVESGGRSREGSFVLIGNGRYYGGPFPVFPNARIDDGLLDVIVLKNVGHLDLIRYMQGVLFGTHVNMNDVEYFQAGSLTVTSDQEVPVEVDGEVIGTTPVTFECGHRKLRVLAPA